MPFSSTLAGPDREEIIHATPDALRRWCFPEGTPEGTPTYHLPAHTENVEHLRRLCAAITESSNGRIEATVTSSEPKSNTAATVVPSPLSVQRRPRGLITNVCISGDGETVHAMRAKILKETPIALVCDITSFFLVGSDC